MVVAQQGIEVGCPSDTNIDSSPGLEPLLMADLLTPSAQLIQICSHQLPLADTLRMEYSTSSIAHTL